MRFWGRRADSRVCSLDRAATGSDAAGRRDEGDDRVKEEAALDRAEAEKRHRFAVRANSILAFIECNEDQRPKLREAIVEAMLWAQTQPK
jgi:hypothetical protein